MGFVGAGEGGVVLETALFGGFLNSGALVDVLVGLEQAFLDDVVVEGVAGFGFEFSH